MSEPILSEYFSDDAPWVKVFRALVDVLKADPVLSRINATWDVREGDSGETIPPNSAQMPWIAVVPMEMTPFLPETEIDYQGRFNVRIDFAVRGTHWNDLGNLAWAVYSALQRNRPTLQGLTVQRYLEQAGANNYWVSRCGVGARRTEQPPTDTAVSPPPAVTDQFASAMVQFQMFVLQETPDYPANPLPPIG